MKMMPKAVRVTSRLSNTAQQLSNLSMFKTKYKKKDGKKEGKAKQRRRTSHEQVSEQMWSIQG